MDKKNPKIPTATDRKYCDVWISNLMDLPEAINDEFDILQDAKCTVLTLDVYPTGNRYIVTIIYTKTK